METFAIVYPDGVKPGPTRKQIAAERRSIAMSVVFRRA
jgi:hypothetical protein